MSVTTSILRQVEQLGYLVSVHRLPGYVELHAVDPRTEELTLARVEGDGDEVLYRAACLLAQAVGMELEDG